MLSVNRSSVPLADKSFDNPIQDTSLNGFNHTLPLYKALKNSYHSGTNHLKKYGYAYDPSLSNGNEQVYYNKTDNKLLFSIAGTHNLKDWGTDAYLAVGKLKDTTRYKEADKVFKEAKSKYPNSKAIVVGHSLGSAISQGVATNKDKVITYNGAYTVGQKTKPNTHAYRTNGDIVSILGSGATHMTNLKNHNSNPLNPLTNHNLVNIKREKIFI